MLRTAKMMENLRSFSKVESGETSAVFFPITLLDPARTAEPDTMPTAHCSAILRFVKPQGCSGRIQLITHNAHTHTHTQHTQTANLHPSLDTQGTPDRTLAREACGGVGPATFFPRISPENLSFLLDEIQPDDDGPLDCDLPRATLGTRAAMLHC